MRLFTVSALIAMLTTSLCFCDGARAGVVLSFTNSSSTNSATVSPGSTFAFTTKLNSTDNATVDQVSAVDYFLAASSSSIFTIASRNTTTDGSPFAGTYITDSGVTSSGSNPILNLTSTAGYRNGIDLGGQLTNFGDPPVSNQLVTVADYTLSVAANAPSGTYTITAYDPSGEGYSDNSFNDHSFTSVGTYSVTIGTPEPAIGGLVVIPALLALRRRRRLARSFSRI